MHLFGDRRGVGPFHVIVKDPWFQRLPTDFKKIVRFIICFIIGHRYHHVISKVFYSNDMGRGHVSSAIIGCDRCSYGYIILVMQKGLIQITPKTMRKIKDLPPKIAKLAIDEVCYSSKSKLRRSEIVQLPLELAFRFDQSQLGPEFWEVVRCMDNSDMEELIKGWEANPDISLKELITVIGILKHGKGS